MRHLLAFVLMIALVGSVAAADLGNVQKDIKTNDHVGMNPGTPDGRVGGDTVNDAVVIAALPYSDTGNTTGFADDYDVACSYTGSTSPDVVYSFSPAADVLATIDLCGSGYDTKTYIFDAAGNVVACNDDFYGSGDACGSWVSKLEGVALTAGETYFIVIDGYGGDAGDYIMDITEFEVEPPCVIEANDDEGEPALTDDYADAFNGGCNSGDYGAPFQALEADENGDLTFGGQSGWYLNAGSNSRDTDWFTAIIGDAGMIEWTVDAEQATAAFLLSPQDCANVAVEESMTAGPCAPATMVIQGTPGDIVWLWLGPAEFTPPVGFVGHEYMYGNTFVGLDAGIIATEGVSFDGIKSLYR